MLLNPDEIIEIKYAWGLGRKTNNQDEMYGLLQGFHIAKDKGLQDIIVLGDLLVTIQYLIKEGRLKENYLVLILQIIRDLITYFHSKGFFQVLRINNMDVDLQENRGFSMGETKLEINDSNYSCPIP